MRASKKLIGFLPKESEEEEKEAIFFWPDIDFSTELLQMAP